MTGGRALVILLLLLLALPLAARAGLALLPQLREMLPGGAGTVRLLAAAFLLCDVAISAALVALLIHGDPRGVPAEDRRPGLLSPGLWRLLLGVAILGYLGLTPLFLMLYLQLR